MPHSFNLPPHNLREMYDSAQLYSLSNDSTLMRALPTFKQAVQLGKHDLSQDKRLAAVQFFAVRADGCLVLLQVRETHHTVLWNFGIHPRHRTGDIVVAGTAIEVNDLPNQSD